MKKGLSLVCFAILFLLQVKAATITSVSAGGNWNTPATWVGGNVPSSSDIAIVAGNVSINSDVTCQRITIGNGKTLSFAGNYTLTIRNSSWNQTCITNNGTFTTTSGSILVDGGGVGLNITGGNAVSISRITLSNVRATFAGNTTISGTLTLTNGAYFTGTHPNYDNNATLEIAQNFSLNGNYYLWASGSGNNVAPNILVSSGTVTAEQIDMYVKKSLQVASGATLNAGAVCMYFVSGFTGVVNNGTARLGGITVSSGATWNISGDYTVSTLKIERNAVVNAGSYTLQIDNSGRNNCNISGNLMDMAAGGTFNAGTGTVVFKPQYWSGIEANGVQGGIVFNNVTVAGNSTLNIPGTSTMTVKGNITINSGASLNQPQHVNIVSTTTVTNNGSVSNGSFPASVPATPSGADGGGNVNASRWAIIKPFTVTSDITFNGSPKVVTIQQGAVLHAGAYTIACDTVYINGEFETTNNNGITGTFGRAIVVIGQQATITYSGASGTQVVTQRNDYANLELHGNGTKSFSNGVYGISGNFTVTGKAPDYAASTLIRFNGTTQQISCASFSNVEFTNSGTKTLQVQTKVISTLTVSDHAVLASDGNLVLVSTAGGTARVAAIPATASISGNVTVQRYVPSIARRSRMISPNVANFTFSDIKDNIFVTGTGGAANGFDASGPNQTTIYTYQESGSRGWKGITNINNTLPAGKGALVFVRGDRRLPAPQWYTAPYVPQNEVTIDFTGTLNQGTISPALSYTNTGSAGEDGWNMVGNPYASQINWNSLAKNNLSGFYYTLNPVTGSYVANTGNSYIASGQAFFVQATGANPSITFTETDKVGNNAVSYFKTTSLPLEIRMIKDSVNEDVAWIAFSNTASKRYTPEEDALKMTNSVINFGFVIDNSTTVQYNTVPEVTAMDTFMLSATAPNGTYTLAFGNVDRTSQVHKFIKDLFTNTLIDLQTTTSYTFSITSNAASKGKRFMLVMVDPSGLPVTWLGFSGKKVNDDAQLSWATASETNNAGFTVERAGSDRKWNAIGTVAGKMNSNSVSSYTFTDRNAFAGDATVAYYRIKQTDKDGSFSYTQVVALYKNGQEAATPAAATVYPNPASSSINADLASVPDNGTIEVLDTYGKQVLATVNVSSLNNTINISSLPVGMYILKVMSNGEAVHVSKFIKE